MEREREQIAGLYIHIPFCRSKCYYCDFYSIQYDDALADKYIDALISEFFSVCEQFQNLYFDTVYLGGGTPSLLSHRLLSKLLGAIFNSNRLKENCEISIESNPAKGEFYKQCADLKINRLSIGIQSLSDSILNLIGRGHNAREAIQALEIAGKYFDNINADIIIGIPSQTKLDIENTLGLIMPFTKHISAYILKLSDESPMGKKARCSQMHLPSDDLVADMYELAYDKLSMYGFNRYEISNFSVANYFSRHNMKYWACWNTIGIGAAAHSFFNGVRFSNASDINRYMLGESFLTTYDKTLIPDKKELLFEEIMLGLRLESGLDVLSINKKFGIDFLSRFSSVIDRLKGIAEYKDGRYKILSSKMLLESAVAVEFLD
ncbi:MAG: radical SAM family heme chaperone HemW [Christensenellaceae bacterium]|jgi:oxygen-independent coproporphyrinogen-3 oxidase|nr:radical SAM family heme chaperone HemW [Christensenellaceae bacterium]